LAKRISTNGNGHNVEADALKALTEARQLREQACLTELTALLEKHNCQLVAVFTVGNQNVSIGKLINLPHQVLIASK
jgi:hypothetical protein